MSFEAGLPNFFALSIDLMRVEKVESGHYYHVYNRGIAKQTIFHSSIDYHRFVDKFLELLERYSITCEAYCLMPNHYHLLLIDKQNSFCKIPNLMQSLQLSYSKYYGFKYDHPGALFQGRYQAKGLRCEESERKIKNYIANNPVEAGLVNCFTDWPYIWISD